MRLTYEDIEKMTGEEVDLYIVKKVMGWRRLENGRLWRDAHSTDWFPISDLNDAVQAAEKVGGNLEMAGIHDPPYWRATVWIKGKDFFGVATTPALAVCRAVISASEKK